MSGVRAKSRMRIHPETGRQLTRDVRPFVVRYKGHARTVMAPGWYPEGRGEGLLVGRDMAVIDRTLDELKAIAHRDTIRFVREVRARLKLSQRQAGLLLGGGPRAFQKYESGEIEPAAPMINLLRVLAARPEAVDVLRAKRRRRQAAV
jgi:HTH-type transcriptional regulator / antitoxin MqsA